MSNPRFAFADITIGYATKRRQPYLIIDGHSVDTRHVAAGGVEVTTPEAPGEPSLVTVTYFADQVVILNSEEAAKEEARRIVAKVFGKEEA